MTNSPRADTGEERSRTAVDYVFPRTGATYVGVFVGILIGIGNAMLRVVFPSWLATLGMLVAALILVLLLHEGLHGGVGWLFRYKPIFGVQPPLVFTTFKERIARNHFIMIAMAPLVLLDVAFVAGFLFASWVVFWDLCFAVNTIGSIGDVWIVTRLLKHPSDTMFQDTKSGLRAWVSSDAGE
jgi:hypothetical protein